jgi:hypothetical protein
MSSQAIMLERLGLMYGKPDVDNVAGFLTEYAKALRIYSADELTRATDHMIRTRKYKTWPTVGECIGACEEAREAHRIKRPAPPIADTSAWADAATQWADNEVRCDDGRTAADEGWLQGLHENLRKNYANNQRRWPNQAELARIIDTARFIDRCASGEQKMGACHEALKKMASRIQQRRTKLADRLFGGSHE